MMRSYYNGTMMMTVAYSCTLMAVMALLVSQVSSFGLPLVLPKLRHEGSVDRIIPRPSTTPTTTMTTTTTTTTTIPVIIEGSADDSEMMDLTIGSSSSSSSSSRRNMLAAALMVVTTGAVLPSSSSLLSSVAQAAVTTATTTTMTTNYNYDLGNDDCQTDCMHKCELLSSSSSSSSTSSSSSSLSQNKNNNNRNKNKNKNKNKNSACEDACVRSGQRYCHQITSSSKSPSAEEAPSSRYIVNTTKEPRIVPNKPIPGLRYSSNRNQGTQME